MTPTNGDRSEDRDTPPLSFERRVVERARVLWRRYGEIPKRWLIFAAVVVVAAIVDERFNSLVNQKLARVTAGVTAALLGTVGIDGRNEGTMIVSQYCVFQIIGECTAYYPCAIFAAAVLAYPCRFLRRVQGIALGLPILLGINQGRLLSLCWIYHWAPGSFETVHLLVWQSLIIFFTVLLWIVWVSTLGRQGDEDQSA